MTRRLKTLVTGLSANHGVWFSSVFLHFIGLQSEHVIFINKTTKESKKWSVRKVTIWASLPFCPELKGRDSTREDISALRWIQNSISNTGNLPLYHFLEWKSVERSWGELHRRIQLGDAPAGLVKGRFPTPRRQSFPGWRAAGGTRTEQQTGPPHSTEATRRLSATF